MTIIDGEFVSDSFEAIMNAMLEDARINFGTDLNDSQVAIIRRFYEPVANRLAEAQEDIGLVLSAAQIDNAEGQSLDLLSGLIGISRERALPSKGDVEFSRSAAASVDYTIPRGTVVQTDSLDPIRFTTDSTAILEAGSTEVVVSVTAEVGGIESDVGADALTIMPNPPSGIESVTNTSTTTGGTERESDDALRRRAKFELAASSSSTAPAIESALQRLEDVLGVSIYTNDTNAVDGDGLPAHSFEAIVEGGDSNEIGQTLFEKKAMGTTSHSGSFGVSETVTATLLNGNEYEVSFSRPTAKQLYVSADLEVTDEYAGVDAVRDIIVSHVGGTFSSTRTHNGELRLGDDVLASRIRAEIMRVSGVYDINSLTLAFDVAPGTGDDGNLAVANNEVAIADATDSSLDIVESP